MDEEHARSSLGGHIAQNRNTECTGTNSPKFVDHAFQDSNEDDNDHTKIHPPNMTEIKVRMLSMWT